MVSFVFFLQTSQDGYCRLLVRLVYHHYLEPTLQSLILLEILLVFVECGCAYGTQFTTSQSRFENVSRVHSTLATASAHQSVNLVYEQYHLAVALHHLLDNRFQTFLKLTFIHCACDKGTHVERVNLTRLQVLRHVAANDTLRQTFSYSRLTHTRLTYQNRVVLGTSRQNLKHTAYLLITADYRVELAFFGQLVEVSGETVQSPVLLSVLLIVKLIVSHIFVTPFFRLSKRNQKPIQRP